MEALGAELIAGMQPPAVIYLRGELGTGKTTLVRGAIRALGYNGLVKSPTFTLVESYSVAKLELHHFDLYRISDPEELECIGLREYFHETAICFIEWPDKGLPALPPPTLSVHIYHQDDHRRVEICT